MALSNFPFWFKSPQPSLSGKESAQGLQNKCLKLFFNVTITYLDIQIVDAFQTFLNLLSKYHTPAFKVINLHRNGILLKIYILVFIDNFLEHLQ